MMVNRNSSALVTTLDPVGSNEVTREPVIVPALEPGFVSALEPVIRPARDPVIKPDREAETPEREPVIVPPYVIVTRQNVSTPAVSIRENFMLILLIKKLLRFRFD